MESHCIALETIKTQKNLRPSVMPSANSQSIANDSKPKPRINNRNSRNYPASKSSCVTTKTEKGFTIAALKNKLRKLKGNSVNTKFAKSSILGKLILHPLRNNSVVRQPTAFKSERPKSSKPRFASQADVNNDLPKPVTTQYFPRERKSAFAKPHHMIAPSSSRYSSNDMVPNHYLEEAKKKTQESGKNLRPSVMPSANSQSIANDSKPKPRINNRNSRNYPASKSSCVTTKTEKGFTIAALKNKLRKLKGNSVNTKFAKSSILGKLILHPLRNNSVVRQPTATPRACLRWKTTGKIFKTVGLRWVPTGKIFASSTNKVDSEPQNGSNEDITNQMNANKLLMSVQSFKEFSSDVQVMTSDHNSLELGIHDHSNEQPSSKLVPKVVPPADKTTMSLQELSYALRWKPCQGDSLNLPDHRIHIKMEMEMPHSS
ncbi:hypothetical protein Tco_0218273 [Tanacetum coccineum]